MRPGWRLTSRNTFLVFCLFGRGFAQLWLLFKFPFLISSFRIISPCWHKSVGSVFLARTFCWWRSMQHERQLQTATKLTMWEDCFLNYGKVGYFLIQSSLLICRILISANPFYGFKIIAYPLLPFFSINDENCFNGFMIK